MEFKRESGRIYYEEDGKVLAEITYPEVRKGVYNITHTFVDKSLGGRGIAGQLVEEAIKDIRSMDGEVIATCSYAVHWLEKYEK